MNAVVFIAIALTLAVIPGYIAYRKGHGFWGFYVFGVFLWIVAVPAALLVKRKPGTSGV